MTIDQKQAIAFLEALTGGRNPLVTFQTFGDNQESKDRGAAIVRHGPLSGEVYKQLKYRHGKGGGVFVMVNEGDCKGRTAQNVVKVRALFLDTDGAPMEPARDQLRPHIVVESSLGKYHLYWRVSDCPLEQFPLLQKAIAARFGGDRSVHDLPRVMRLPGFWHQKGTPVMTRLVKTADFPPYTIAEVVEGLGLVLESAGTRAKAQDRPRVEALPTVSEDAPFEIVDPATGETVDLVDWAVKHPDFRLASALREHAPPDVLGGTSATASSTFVAPSSMSTRSKAQTRRHSARTVKRPRRRRVSSLSACTLTAPTGTGWRSSRRCFSADGFRFQP